MEKNHRLPYIKILVQERRIVNSYSGNIIIITLKLYIITRTYINNGPYYEGEAPTPLTRSMVL